LSGKRFYLAPGAFGFFGGVYGFGKKTKDGITVLTIEFINRHDRSLETISKMHLTPDSFAVSLLKMLTY
jgi:hypothetical protein